MCHGRGCRKRTGPRNSLANAVLRLDLTEMSARKSSVPQSFCAYIRPIQRLAERNPRYLPDCYVAQRGTLIAKSSRAASGLSTEINRLEREWESYGYPVCVVVDL